MGEKLWRVSVELTQSDFPATTTTSTSGVGSGSSSSVPSTSN